MMKGENLDALNGYAVTGIRNIKKCSRGIFLFFFVLAGQLCWGQQTYPIDHHVSLTNREAQVISDNLFSSPYPTTTDNWRTLIEVQSLLTDTSSWIITPGSYDILDIRIIRRTDTTFYQSGHYVPNSLKASRSWLTYPHSLYLRLGMMNQFPLFLAAGESLVIEIIARHPSQFPVYSEVSILPSHTTTFREDLPLVFLELIFLGIILALVLYHVMQYFIVRDSLYLFYGLYMVSILLHLLEYSGMVSELLIPEHPELRLYLKSLIDYGIFVSYLQLLRVFVNTSTQLPKFDRLLVRMIQAYSLLLPAIWLWLSLGGNSYLAFLTTPSTVVLPFAAVIYMTRPILRTGGIPARYFVVGTGFLVIGTLVNLSVVSNIFGNQDSLGAFSRVHYLQVGAMFELLLFAIGIGHRIRLNELAQQKATEINQLQSRFIANLSHEFRSPLTLIMGPAAELLERKITPSVREAASIIYKNAQRLMGQINELLDLAKLESGSVLLQAEEIDLLDLLTIRIASFESMARSKKILLSFDTELNKLMAWLDREKIEKVVDNLLSNALKFTPNGGHVRVMAWSEEEYAYISISDSGAGIPSGDLPFIFDRFYQVDSTQDGKPTGTGIGLAFTRELVTLHQGEIQVTSEVGTGSEFTIRLPLGKAHLRHEDIPDAERTLAHPQHGDRRSIYSGGGYALPLAESEASLPGLPLVLVVEDNPDLQNYLHSILSEFFRVDMASDGETGWSKVLHINPDLIISDIMMPRLNGFELCNRLKNDATTNHIPIILLTARAEMESRLQGLHVGADDYLVKPFHPRELRLRSENLIEQRRRLRTAYNNWVILPEAPLPDHDRPEHAFVSQAKSILENFHSNPDFTVEQFAAEVSMSRKQLLRKTRSLMNVTPSELIRSYRLERAAQLLRGPDETVAEVAYKVGFQNLSYFSKSFREAHGISPSAFMQNIHQSFE